MLKKTASERLGYIEIPGQTIPVWYIDETNVIMFDSGHATQKEALLTRINEMKIIPRAVLTSHIHLDHIGNHIELRNRFGTEIWFTEIEKELLASRDFQMLIYPNFGQNYLVNLTKGMTIEPDYVIKNDAIDISVCGECFRILPLPGHSPEQIGFIFPNDWIYVGDLIMDESFSEHAKYPYNMSWVSHIESINTIRQSCDRQVIIAHSGTHTSIHELAEVNLRHIQEHMKKLLYQIKQGNSFDDVMQCLYTNREFRVSEYIVINRTIKWMLNFLVDIDCLYLDITNCKLTYGITGKDVPNLLDFHEWDKGY